jgi:hypothetical protein
MRAGHAGAESCAKDSIREVATVTATVDLFARQRLRQRRAAAAATFGVLALLAAAVLVAAPEDVHTQAALPGYLDRAEGRMLLAWILSVLAGLAWLCLVVALRRMLPHGGGRDLFVAAAVSGQAAAWSGVSLGAAAAVPDAHQIPLPVFTAFGEAAHLAGAAATAAMGLALLGLAAAVRSGRAPLPRWFGWLTAGVGVVLIPAAVIGPVSLPVTALWLLALGTLLLAKPPVTADAAESTDSRVPV